MATASRELRRQLGLLAAFTAAQDEQETPVGRYLAGLPAEPAGAWWSAVYPALPPQEGAAADAVTLEGILAVSDSVAAQDAASALARQERLRNATERAGLVAHQLAVHAQDLKRQQLVDAVAAAKGRIAAFDVDSFSGATSNASLAALNRLSSLSATGSMEAKRVALLEQLISYITGGSSGRGTRTCIRYLAQQHCLNQRVDFARRLQSLEGNDARSLFLSNTTSRRLPVCVKLLT